MCAVKYLGQAGVNLGKVLGVINVRWAIEGSNIQVASTGQIYLNPCHFNVAVGSKFFWLQAVEAVPVMFQFRCKTVLKEIASI